MPVCKSHSIPEKRAFCVIMTAIFFLTFFVCTKASMAEKRRGDWAFLWKIPLAGTVYYSLKKAAEDQKEGVSYFFSNQSFRKRGKSDEIIRELFIPYNFDKNPGKRSLRKILDTHIRDYLKKQTSLSHHVEWIHRDYEIFKEYLNKIEQRLIQSKSGEEPKVNLDYNKKAHQTELYALQQSLKKHPVHKSDKKLKIRREIEQIMLLFPEIRKDETYGYFLNFYWHHMLKRLRHEKYMTRFINFGTPLVFALGLSSIIIVATSGAALLPLAITGAVVSGFVGAAQTGLALHKWRNTEKLAKISKRFLKFDERVRNLLAHLIEKKDKTHEEFSAMNYLEELHEFNKKRKLLFDELIRARTENRIRLAGGIMELLSCLSSVESLAFSQGAMHHLASALSSEHQGLWASLSANIFNTVSVAVNGVDMQNHANSDIDKHNRWKHIKDKIRRGLSGETGTEDYDPLLSPKH